MSQSFKGLISGKQVNTLSSDLIMSDLQAKSLEVLTGQEYLYVLHDPCDIRKEYSDKMEYLGEVRDLSNTRNISGYKSLNSVVVIPKQKEVNLLFHEVYSTGSANYLSKSSADKLEKQSKKGDNSLPKDVSSEERALYEEGDYVNTSVMYKKAVSTSSYLLKQGLEKVKICHISDREFDGSIYYEYISSLGDTFITRLKISRCSNERELVYTPKGKISKRKQYKKLLDKSFRGQGFYEIEVLKIKSKTYHKVSCQLEWEALELEGEIYNVVRVTLKQGNKSLFTHPMLLLTNQSVNTAEEAKAVYQAYLLRFKIEVVFRFMKQQLGWETFQVRDFESIKNLLALVFYLVGYFEELKDALQEHPLADFLCKIAKSKGKITPYFLLKGVEYLVIHQKIQEEMERHNISNEQVKEFLKQFRQNE